MTGPSIRIPGLPDFNAGDSRFRIRDFDGWYTRAQPRAELVPSGAAPGAVAIGPWDDAEAYYELSGFIKDSDRAQLQTFRRDLLEALRADQDTTVTVFGNDEEPDLTTQVRLYDRPTVDVFANVCEFTFPLVSTDPLRYGLTALTGQFGVFTGDEWFTLMTVDTVGLDLDGTSGTDASAPDAAALDIAGDLEVTARVAPDDWMTGSNHQVILSKGLSAYELRLNSAGRLDLFWTNGSEQSTVATGFADGSEHWVQAMLDVDNGAGAYEVKFFTSNDPAGTDPDTVTWTQLGDTLTGAATSIAANTDELSVGSRGGSVPFAGIVGYAEVRDDGTVVADPDFADQVAGTTSFDDDAGNTWTLNGAAKILTLGIDLTQDAAPTPDEFYVEFEQALQSGSFAPSLVVTSEGDATSRKLVFDVTGPLTKGDWQLLHENTGDQLTVDLGLTAQQTVRFDCHAQTATLNGSPIDSLVFGDWLTLEPGSNTYRLTAGAASDGFASLVEGLQAYR